MNAQEVAVRTRSWRESSSHWTHVSSAIVLLVMVLACACTSTGHEAVANDGAIEHKLVWAQPRSESPTLGELAPASGLPDEELLGVSNMVLPTSLPTGAWRQAPTEKWDFDVALYAWAVNVNGALATQSGIGVPIDQSFSDTLSSVQMGAMVYHEGRKGQWGYQVDLIYADLDSETPGLTGDIDVGVKALIGEVDVTFSPLADPSLQFLVGARVLDIEQSVTFPLGPTEDGSDTLIDPVFGAQGSFAIADNWGLRLRADFGGFGVGSELTYQALGVFAWKFARDWNLHFGYRLLGYDIKEGDVNLDMQMHGALVGVSVSF